MLQLLNGFTLRDGAVVNLAQMRNALVTHISRNFERARLVYACPSEEGERVCYQARTEAGGATGY